MCGWDGGDGGPKETNTFNPDPGELKNPQVEPILKKYLELRYRLLIYTYTATQESCDTERRLTLRMARGSRLLPPARRTFEVRAAGEKTKKTIVFDGNVLDIHV